MGKINISRNKNNALVIYPAIDYIICVHVIVYVCDFKSLIFKKKIVRE